MENIIYMEHMIQINGVKIRTCKFLCEKPGNIKVDPRGLRVGDGILDLKNSHLIEGRLYPKINYDRCDETTKVIVGKIRARSEISVIKGLINFRSGEMHLENAGKLGVSCNHIDLAKQYGLLKNENLLKDDWHGFSMNCGDLDIGDLIVSPLSDRYGGIPIEYASVFERHINELVGKNTDKNTVEILYFHLLYLRSLSKRQISYLDNLSGANIKLVPKSMSDEELRKFLPGA
jgi:hypothetical protein